MISIKVMDNQITTMLGGDCVNAWVILLDEMKTWAKEMNLQYVPAGSTIKSIEPGQWCVKSYDYNARTRHGSGGIWPYRLICFHEEDSIHAMLFKLRWGGSA